ncbi:MAG: alpha/beta fold hydrolase [Bacteroidales bacterium]|nr:alpha/beta fold hydrolase [Bacteroidales bacterium]
MKNYIQFNKAVICYTDEGAGIPLVFLHGYLESLDIWEPFTDKLKNTFRIIRIDIPGHGRSGILDETHTMNKMAEAVKYVVENLSIEKFILVGHSMGGYVTLAFANLFSEMLLGFVLFHSTPLADTEEKKQNRDREIELIKSGKKELIVNTNIPKGFATDNLTKLADEVQRAKQIGNETSNEGIITLLNGMKTRADHSQNLKETTLPHLWILGIKDNYIVFDSIRQKINLNEHGENGCFGKLGTHGVY